MKSNNKIVGIDQVFDYVYRPDELSDLTLYEWVCRCSRIKATAIKASASREDNGEVDDDVDL